MSSTVAASGERCRNAANRLQLLMWSLCVPAPSLRGHVLDHALAKRADNIDAHGEPVRLPESPVKNSEAIEPCRH
jgi:hypothetical protein